MTEETGAKSRAVKFLEWLGIFAVAVAGMSLTLSYYAESELLVSFYLGIFGAFIVSSVILFGFSKVVAVLERISAQLRTESGDRGPEWLRHFAAREAVNDADKRLTQ